MGKVQDTSSRLKQRHRPHSSPEIALIIPSQQKPSRHSFPTTYQAVSDWVSTQLSNGFDSGLNGLMKGLLHSNRLTNSPIERLKVMDLFAEQTQRTMPHLITRYTGTSLPYSLPAQTAFKQVVTLLTELSFGYKIALVDVLLGRGKLTQKARVHAIYQAMHAIAQCGLRHSQSYQPWPDKFWRDINTLMLLAEHEKALDAPVGAAFDTKKAPNTIRQLYATLAIFWVNRAEQLKPHQMDALFTTLSNDPHPVELLTEKPQKCTTPIYSVALNSATPPALDRFCHYSEHHQLRYFTIKPSAIKTLDNKKEDNASSSSPQHSHYQSNNSKSQSTARQHARAIRHADFYTQRNLKNITASLNAITQRNTLVRPSSGKWTLINESTGGVGLLSTDTGDCNTCLGDLIAWKLEKKNPQHITCTVGVVRWLHSQVDDALRVGVEKIGQSARNVSISTVDKKPTENNATVDALLCKSATPESVLTLVLLPPNKFKTGESVNLSIAGSKRQSLMILSEKLQKNSLFDCFIISEAPRLL